MILYFAADLLWGTRIKSTADALSIPCRPARTPEMLAARLADSDVRALIVDLETGEPGLDLITRLRAADPGRHVRVVAFGPHVEVEMLRRAREVGADEAMPRGAFDQRLPRLLTELAGR